MITLHPTQVTVDLEAIRHNYQSIRQRVPEGQKVLCVVKSNAYGHGLESVSQALAQAGADYFGVRDIDEGIRLRQAGIEAPILFLLGIVDQAFQEITTYRLTPVIFELETARLLNDYLQQEQLTLPIHVKIDTGMTRLGVPAENAEDFFGELKSLDRLQVEGVLTHLADATDEEYTKKQTQTMTQVRQRITAAGWEIELWHFSNSIGAIRTLYPESQMVRAGIVLYGSYPSPDMQEEITLKPALRWTTQVLDVKSVEAGTPISYECTFVTRRPSRIAVLPIGYADGYSRLLSNRGEVLIKGRRAPIVGRVCMDLTVIDVTDIPEVAQGDTVTVLGEDGSEHITAEEMAAWADTISYEILASISTRVPRHYQG